MFANKAWSMRDIRDYVAATWQGKRVKVEPFQYPVNFGVIADGASAVESVNMTGDSDFVLLSLFSIFTENDGSVLTPVLSTLVIEDTASNEKFTSSPAFLDLYTNTAFGLLGGTSYKRLPFPRRCPAASTLQLTLTQNINPAPAAATAVVVLDGVRVWEYSQ